MAYFILVPVGNKGLPFQNQKEHGSKGYQLKWENTRDPLGVLLLRNTNVRVSAMAS